ncbi:14391_t:CDS:1, partial [Dentiscutata erythropus]
KEHFGTGGRRMEDQESIVLLIKMIVEVIDKLVKDVKMLQAEQRRLKPLKLGKRNWITKNVK